MAQRETRKMMFENRHSKKKRSFSIEKQFSTQLSFSIPSFQGFNIILAEKFSSNLKQKFFVYCSAFDATVICSSRISLGNQSVLGLQNIDKYLIIKVNFRFTHVSFMEDLGSFQLKKLWNFITIPGVLFTFLTNKSYFLHLQTIWYLHF